MSYTYATYSAALALMMAVDSVNEANFQAILPSIIDSAEQRMCRDIDFLSSITTDTTASLTAGVRKMALPTDVKFITLQSVVVVTPAGGNNPEFPTRNALDAVSRELLDAVYPNQVPLAIPKWFSVLDQSSILVGPYPDQAYQVEITGTARPLPLSAANTTTFIATYLPDVFLAASMIFAAGYQKNFGAQSDDPQMSLSWDAQYSKLLAGAQMEEARKKNQASGWTSLAPAAAATPSR